MVIFTSLQEEDSEIQNEPDQQEQSLDTIRSPETEDSNKIIKNGDTYQADVGLPPIMGICINQDLGKNEVEEENNSEAIMIAGLLPPMNHTSEDYSNRKKRKKKKKHKNNQKEKFIDDNEYHQIHNNDNEGKKNEGIKICDNVADEGIDEIKDGHKEISAIINIDNECKSEETRKKKKKKRKKSKLNKVHPTYDEPEETPFNVEAYKITSASNEDDEHAQSHKTEIIKAKSAEVETDSLYGESVGDTQEK